MENLVPGFFRPASFGFGLNQAMLAGAA